jgi:phenylalanyl-tRNA synthetase beta chain
VRVPLSWLREFTPIEAEPRAVAEALDQLGLEVEAVEDLGAELGGVVVARALEVRRHPDADRLSLVEVDTGAGVVQVVCGATNVTPGMTVPWAGPGAQLPGGVRLEARTIRGQRSEGMLCSAAELGIGDDQAGILALEDTLEPGTDLREALGLDDVVLELSITPNRPDAMSIVGVARELAARFGTPLRVPDPQPRPDPDLAPTAELVSVEVEAPDRAPRFTARYLRVRTGPSPAWLARRLRLAGVRSISNVVDVTNYVLIERGQPLHAFDLAHLAGRGLVVRLAAPGETITTLDGVERELTADDLLVCDAERRPQAIAGIMGGAEAEVRPDTSEILLEAAYFAPMGIARTSKRLGVRSESSARFERGIDPNGVLTGSARAAELLAEVADASMAPEPIDRYPHPIRPARIRLRTARANALLGTDLDDAAVRAALEPLGLTVAPTGEAGVAEVEVPTYRPDLEREVDLVEEVARRIGLDTIPRTRPDTSVQVGGLTAAQREHRALADACVGLGLAEAMTIPLLGPRALEAFGLPTRGWVEATNALRADEPVLRPAILPGLCGAVAHNLAHGLGDVALFETGRVFRPPRPGDLLPDEREHLAAVWAGQVRRAPVEPDRPVDAYDATDAVGVLAAALELDRWWLEPVDAPGFAPGRCAAVMVEIEAQAEGEGAGEALASQGRAGRGSARSHRDGPDRDAPDVGARVAGHVGELAGGTVTALGLPGPVAALELDLDVLRAGRRRDRTFRPLSRYPASTIDLAFACAEGVPVAALAATLRDAAGELLEDLRCFDVFRSDELAAAGRKSVAFSLRFRAPDRTLTDAEVAGVRARCIEAVTRTHDASLR